MIIHVYCIIICLKEVHIAVMISNSFLACKVTSKNSVLLLVIKSFSGRYKVSSISYYRLIFKIRTRWRFLLFSQPIDITSIDEKDCQRHLLAIALHFFPFG